MFRGEVGPEFPGEGAIHSIYRWVFSQVRFWKHTQKKKNWLRMCSCNTPKKSIKEKSSVSLEPETITGLLSCKVLETHREKKGSECAPVTHQKNQ